MSTIKNQRCFTEATASARLILATGLPGIIFGCMQSAHRFFGEFRTLLWIHFVSLQFGALSRATFVESIIEVLYFT